MVDVKNSLYGYAPSLPATLVVAIAFLVVFLAHSFLLARHKSWYMVPFVIGVGAESVGYFIRRASASDSDSTKLYIMETLFIILAP